MLLAITRGATKDTQRRSLFSDGMLKGSRAIRMAAAGACGTVALVCFRKRHAGWIKSRKASAINPGYGESLASAVG
jgi:hypothetical protein